MADTIMRLSLDVAITSLLGRKGDPLYRDIGHDMKVKTLYELLGLKGSPMLYKYMDGTTKKLEPERALIILDKFDILVDLWEDEEELRREAVNVGNSKEMAKQPFIEVMEDLIKLETAKSMTTMKRGIRRILAKYY